MKMQPRIKCPHCDGNGTVLNPVFEGMKKRGTRERYGLTLRELARRMKITATYLCDLEHGRRRWTVDIHKRFMSEVGK